MNLKEYEIPELEVVHMTSESVLTQSEWDNTEGGEFDGLQ